MKILAPAISALLLVLWGGMPLFAQTEDMPMKGIVSIQNSGFKNKGVREFVSGASVSAPGAIPKTTDQYGLFTLLFSGLPEHTLVRLSIKKEGLEVVNKKEISESAEVGRVRPLNIYMCPAGELESRIIEYYNISVENDERVIRLRKEIADLNRQMNQLKESAEADEKQKQELAIAREDLAKLNRLYQRTLEEINRWAEQFALVNLDDESELYAAALDTFLKGHVLEAIVILKRVDFEKRLLENQANIEKGNRIMANIENQVERSRRQIEEDVRSVVLLAQIYRSRYEADSADYYYELAIRYDSSNIGILYDYATHLEETRRYSQSMALTQRLLVLTANQSAQRADAFGLLALLYPNTVENSYYRYLLEDSVRYCLLEELKIREKLLREAPDDDLLEHKLADLYIRLGDFYELRSMHYYYKIWDDSAKTYLLSNLRLRQDLLAKNTGSNLLQDNVAAALRRLGRFFEYPERQVDSAALFYRAEIAFWEDNIRKKPENERLLINLAESCNHMGWYYSVVPTNLDSALAYYLTELDIWKILYRQKPEDGELQQLIAEKHRRLGDLFTYEQMNHRAAPYYLKETKFWEECLKKTPRDGRLRFGLAGSYKKRGEFYYYHAGDIDSALICFQEELKVLQSLHRDDPGNEEWLIALARSNDMLGTLNKGSEREEEAVAYWKEALRYYEEPCLHSVSPNCMLGIIDELFQKLQAYFVFFSRYDSASVYYGRELKFWENLHRQEPRLEIWQSEYARAHEKMAAFMEFRSNVDAAESHYLAALDLWKNLYKTNPSNPYNRDTLAARFRQMGNFYKLQDKRVNAHAYYATELEFWEDAQNQEPENNFLQIEIAGIYGYLGDFYVHIKQDDSAFICYHKELDILERCLSDEPQDLYFASMLGWAYRHVAFFYQSRGDYESAASLLYKDLALKQAAHEDDVELEGPQVDLAITWKYLGDLDLLRGNLEDALASYTNCILILEGIQRQYGSVILIEEEALDLDFDTLYHRLVRVSEGLGWPQNYLEFYNRAAGYFRARYSSDTLVVHLHLFERIEKAIFAVESAKDSSLAWEHYLERQVLYASNPHEKVRFQEELVAWVSKSGKPDWPVRMAATYTDLASYLLAVREFRRAESAARSAMDLLDLDQQGIASIKLALSLLHQGRYNRAKHICKRFKDTFYDEEQDWSSAFISELIDLEALLGTKHEDSERIQRLLQK